MVHPAMRMHFFLAVLPLVLLSLFLLYSSSIHNASPALSRQACQMAYMSPSYLHITSLNASVTPLADKYKLFLYREAGWDADRTVSLIFRYPNSAVSYVDVLKRRLRGSSQTGSLSCTFPAMPAA